MRKEFLNELLECEDKIKYFETIRKWIGYAKIITFVIFITCLIRLITSEFNFILAIGVLALFELCILMVVIHWKTKILREENVIKKQIRQDYVDRIDGNWKYFEDKGSEFADENTDSFGEGSLFQYINTTKTWHGRKQFALDLNDPNFNRETKKHHEAVWELSSNKNFTVNFQYEGFKIAADRNIENLIALLKIKENKTNSIPKAIRYLFYIPIFTSIFSLFVFIVKVRTLYIPATFFLSLHIALWIFSILKYRIQFNQISNTKFRMKDYSNLFNMIERRTFECESLRKLKEKICSNDMKASQAIAELDSIIIRIKLRKNFVLYFILNLFFIWDVNCAFSITNWQYKYGQNMEVWFKALGELESFLSFSNLSFVEDDS